MNFQVNAITTDCHYFVGYYYYTCSMRNTDVFNGERQMICNKVGQHFIDKTNKHVKFFEINRANVGLFPRNLENVFDGLIGIKMRKCELTQITENDLQPFINLKNLDLSHNKIKSLAADTFFNNPNLEKISLPFNEIEHIEPTAFSNLNKLRSLILYQNACKWMTGPLSKSSVELLIVKIKNKKCFSQEYANSSTITKLEPTLEHCPKIQQNGKEPKNLASKMTFSLPFLLNIFISMKITLAKFNTT